VFDVFEYINELNRVNILHCAAGKILVVYHSTYFTFTLKLDQNTTLIRALLCPTELIININ